MEVSRVSAKEPFAIFRRTGSTVWWTRFSIRGEGQIRKSLATTDEAEARRLASKMWHEAQYRSENGLKAVQRSFRTIAEEFIENMHELVRLGEKRFDRADRVEPLVRRYFIPYFDGKAIDAITDADITRYVDWRKSFWITGPGKDQTHIEYERKGRRVKRPATDMRRVPSLSTQRGEAVVLRQLFRQAAKWGYINQSQIPDVETPRVPPSPRPSFSAAEIEQLRALAEQRMMDPAINQEVRRDRTVLYAYVTLAANSGMRPTELRNLNWGDVLGYRACIGAPFEKRDIRLIARGKAKSREFIPHHGALAAFDLLWMLWKRDHGSLPNDSDPVFSSSSGNRLTSLNNSLTALLVAANLRTNHLGKKRDSYSFRHFYISQQIRSGVDVFVLARNAGTSPDMIDKFYGQVSVEQFKDALRPAWV